MPVLVDATRTGAWAAEAFRMLGGTVYPEIGANGRGRPPVRRVSPGA